MFTILKKNKTTDKFPVFMELSYNLGGKADQKKSKIIVHWHVYYEKSKYKYKIEWRDIKEGSPSEEGFGFVLFFKADTKMDLVMGARNEEG